MPGGSTLSGSLQIQANVAVFLQHAGQTRCLCNSMLWNTGRQTRDAQNARQHAKISFRTLAA